MENYNQTSTDFMLLWLFPSSRTGLFLFIFIAFIFLMALVGNLSMILLIFLDIHLPTPMYILLSQLSLMDLNYISTTVPKIAYDFLFANKSISIIGCGIQSFFLTMAGTEGLLLASMAYDRYVAICFPLHYPIKISKRVCMLMMTGSWITSSINSCAHTTYILSIPYCQSRSINHLFCDVIVMLTIACTDTMVYEYTVFLSTTLFLLLPFTGIAFSYGRVLLAVYHMNSAEGKKKACSTCSTHLTVVSFYYAPFAYMYLCPRFLHTPTEDKVLAVFYTILTPMLNPIYTAWETRRWWGPWEE